MSPHQRTIGKKIKLDGHGVHSGEAATLTLKPAPADHGIRFCRVDLDDAPEIPAVLENVVDTQLGTSLGLGEAKVLTVEHLMSALNAGGIDILKGPEYHENGVFAWIMDPEGNKIELWEPMIWNEKNKK